MGGFLALMKRLLQQLIDWWTDRWWLAVGLAAVLTAVLTFVLADFGKTLFDASLPSSASVAFSLFGLSVAAISILATLKTAPFMALLEVRNPRLFKHLVDYFVIAIVFLFSWGFLGLFVPKEIAQNGLPVWLVMTIKATYFFLMFSSLSLSLSSVWLLRLLLLARVT